MAFGYRYDTETGMYYLQSRYYNPEWGRFINADALGGQVGSLLSHNIFIYCQNNVVNMADPIGYLCSAISDFGGIYKHVKCKTFYADIEGPKIDVFKKSYKITTKGRKIEKSTEIFGMQLISGETGIAKVYGDYKYGKWHIQDLSRCWYIFIKNKRICIW